MAGGIWSALGAAILGGNQGYQHALDRNRQIKQQDFENTIKQGQFDQGSQLNALQMAIAQMNLDQAPADLAAKKAQGIYQLSPELAFDNPDFLALREKAGMPVPTMDPNARLGAIENQPAGIRPETIAQGGSPLPFAQHTGAQLPPELLQQREEKQSALDSREMNRNYVGAQMQQMQAAPQREAEKEGRMHGYRMEEIGAQSKGQMAVAGVRAAGVGPNAPLKPKDQATLTRSLANDWNKFSAPARVVHTQVAMMDQALKANAANPAAAAQAIAVTFQKILDPNSVVRESEYARTPEGQSLLNRMQGAYERLSQGGIGVPAEELAKFATVAHELAASQEQFLAPERDRMSAMAENFGLKPDLIIGSLPALPQTGADPTGPAAGPAPAGAAPKAGDTLTYAQVVAQAQKTKRDPQQLASQLMAAGVKVVKQ